jgi:hypothetical protein
MEFFLAWLVLAVVVGIVASNRGRSGFGYFLLSLILSPLIGLIILLILGRNEGDQRKCPACAEMIKAEASKCRFCGTEVTPVATSQQYY